MTFEMTWNEMVQYMSAVDYVGKKGGKVGSMPSSDMSIEFPEGLKGSPVFATPQEFINFVWGMQFYEDNRDKLQDYRGSIVEPT